MNTQSFELFDSQEKAIDHAIWLNFKYRISETRFGVIAGPENNWAVTDVQTSQELDMPFLEILPDDYIEISYDHLRHIAMDKEPLRHWEEITGSISIMDGEILRFILDTKLPFEKLIRFELAKRGFDKDNRWCGFDKSVEIWLE